MKRFSLRTEMLTRIGAYVLVIAAVAVSFYSYQSWTTRAIKSNQYHACLRGNRLRGNINGEVGVLRDFLTTARQTRTAAAKSYRLQGNAAQAKINQAAADKYKKQLKNLKNVPMTNCHKVIK